MLLLALAGLLIAAELTYLHMKVFLDPHYKSFCAINSTFNCESVAFSPYSILFNVPVSVWGLLGYLQILLVLFLGIRKPKRSEVLYGALLALTLISFVTSVGFAYIAFAKIKSYCIFCIGTYAINALLLPLALVALLKEDFSPLRSLGSFIYWGFKNLQLMIFPAFIVAVLLMGYPRYWQLSMDWKDGHLAQGIHDGHAWIGAKKPKLKIVEFADYECPYCKRAHKKVREFVRKNSDIIQLVHRHYPLDKSCNRKMQRDLHKNACLFARAAFCAGKQKRFWQLSDVLYSKSKELDQKKILIWAKKFKLDVQKFEDCLEDDDTHISIAQDLLSGDHLGVRGTPFFMLNGIPQKKFFKSLEEAISRIRTGKALTLKKSKAASPPIHVHKHPSKPTIKAKSKKASSQPSTKTAPANR